MPFLTTTPQKPVYMRELLKVQDLDAYCAAQDKLERNFRIKFSICLLSAVFAGAFLFAAAVL